MSVREKWTKVHLVLYKLILELKIRFSTPDLSLKLVRIAPSDTICTAWPLDVSVNLIVSEFLCVLKSPREQTPHCGIYTHSFPQS